MENSPVKHRGREKGSITVHLYRGASPVRSWSKYKTTVKTKTLCGVDVQPKRTGVDNLIRVSEAVSDINCRFCLQLLS